MGLLLQRSLLVCSLGMVCTTAIWSQLDRLLLLAGDPTKSTQHGQQAAASVCMLP